jgi:hypothetical protein
MRTAEQRARATYWAERLRTAAREHTEKGPAPGVHPRIFRAAIDGMLSMADSLDAEARGATGAPVFGSGARRHEG